MEHEDAKIAESWWSGTGPRGEVAPAPPPAPQPSTDAEWDALRKKFVASHHPPEPVETPRRIKALRPLLLVLPVLGIAVLAALYLAGKGDSLVPANVRNLMDAIVAEQPVSMATDEAPDAAAGAKQQRGRRARRVAPAPSAVRSAGAPVVAEVPRERPFTIEVIDRNRRTILHAYGAPLPLAVGDAHPMPGVVRDVPNLLIEETITPDGVASRTTNVGASVVLTGTVSTDGRMRDVHVVRGPAEFVPAAIEAVRRWRFNVVQQGGVPVERPARVTVNMAIKTDGTISPGTK